MKLRWLAAVLPLLLLVPDAAHAQRGRGWKPNPWSFSPYAGAFRDAYDISADGDDTGWQLGFRLGYDVGGRTRLAATIGYAESDDVAFNPPAVPYVFLDNQYIITTGGAEYDILPGNTAVALGVELGGLWRKVAFDRALGETEPFVGDGYAFNFTVAPQLTLRHGFTRRAALEVNIRDYILPEDRVEHMPALGVGFRFR